MAIVGDALMDMHGIAKIAGVSSATVSRVISGSKLVRPETTERVQQVIDELKFFPNSSATTLKHGKSSTYGLIIPDITNPFFPEFIRCFEKILVENNRDMLMATIDSHATRMQQSVRRMLVRKVDGVVLLAAEIETEPIEALIHNKVPLVTLERRLVAPWVSDVMVNYAAGIGLAVAHLKELGHTKIGYIGASAGPTISNHRVNGFKKALKKYGLQLYPEFIRVGDYRTTGWPDGHDGVAGAEGEADRHSGRERSDGHRCVAHDLSARIHRPGRFFGDRVRRYRFGRYAVSAADDAVSTASGAGGDRLQGARVWQGAQERGGAAVHDEDEPGGA
jgi:DNA-binding LacI/PurR family transcriptional regulator